MPNVGPLELAIVLIVALIILGPKKLPDMGRSLGRSMREFKGAISGDSREDEAPALNESRADADTSAVNESRADADATALDESDSEESDAAVRREHTAAAV